MAKKQNDVRAYGAELGVGLKQGLQGLNTVCSPKKRKMATMLVLVPLVLFILFLAIGLSTGNDGLTGVSVLFGLCLGLYQFYVGKIKKGLIFTITMGGFAIGCVIDLLKLNVSKTFTDANGFPLIY